MHDPLGFSDGTNTGNDFMYDNNGNVTEDKNKEIAIDYNYLNLPSNINSTENSDYISYIYDAAGTKWVKRYSGTSKKNTLYAGSFVYIDTDGDAYIDNLSLDYIINSEGKIEMTGSTINNYEYHLKDHLGNTRVTFNAGSSTIIQSPDYYPFGMNFASSQGGANKYLYNGKEMQDETLNGKNLDWYDYGARFYDPAIGRWHVPDPLAEVNRRWSPYRYAYNNPLRFIDPDGMLEDDYFNENGVYLGSDEAETDYVRVIDQMTWDTHKNDGIIESIKHETGEQLSVFHSEAGISEEASLEIYDHYNPTGAEIVKIEDGPLTTGMNYDGAIDKIGIRLEGNLNAGYADDANIIKNQFSHEVRHYDDRHNGTGSVSRSINEIRATVKMLNDPSFDKINDARYRRGAFDYLYHYLSTEKKK